MGLRSFLKSKVEKHGSVGAAAKAAIQRPLVLFNGGAGMRSAAPDADLGLDKLQAAFTNLPTKPDAGGRTAVGPADFVKAGKAGTFNAPDGRSVAVFRIDGQLHAIDGTCTHEDGPLGEADKIDGHVITCPYHDWKFDVRDGSCLADPNRPVPCYDVAEHDGYIWLGRARGQALLDRGGEHDDGLATRLAETTRIK
jgi:nitrite reductase (NADH) small subunit